MAGSRKKVIWIVNEYNFPDAVKSRQTNLCTLLNERGYDCYIISGSSSNKEGANRLQGRELYQYIETDEAKGYIIKTTDYKGNYGRALVALQFQARLWNIQKQLPIPDVIVSEFAGFFGNVFLRWKKGYGTRIIYDILDLWPEGFIDMGFLKKTSLIAKILYNMEHKSYREADGIIFSMQGGRDYLIDKGWSTEVGGDVDTNHIGYLNNGVDLETFDRKRDMFFLEDEDLASDKFKAIYIGSISQFNELDILVETARILQVNGITDIIILIYGYGNQEDRLRNLVDKYRLQNIKFKGKLEKQYAMNVLSRGDVNLFTFKEIPLLKYGVSPNKLFLYFASGKPVLSLIQPAYDLVEERRAGMSVPHNPNIVANALIRFSKMPTEEYQCYCKNARKLAQEYDYKNLVNVLIGQIEGEMK